MPTFIPAAKLYPPEAARATVRRSRLIDQLNTGLAGRLTLVSAPAGFGKSTLVSQWMAVVDRRHAWLSLDSGDSDPLTFMAGLIAALQPLAPRLAERLLPAVQAPQPPSTESILAALLSALAEVPFPFILVLDDYHAVDSTRVDADLATLIDYMPRQMHVVIATREDPNLPLARLRIQGNLSELRGSDLRFTVGEAGAFCAERMQVALDPEDLAALDERIEGWAAGLQLAAISMQGHPDRAGFIRAFTGSHRFVLDYLVEEVLDRQPAETQAFLLRSSILNRLTGPLCDALLPTSAARGQAMLGQLERANLFLIPLDEERRWYRYHHLFADLLRQRLLDAEGVAGVEALHQRASAWFEANGLALEAFQHAVAAHDVDRAARLLGGDRVPLYMRGAAVPALDWLRSLPAPTLMERPALIVHYASALLFLSQIGSIEPLLQMAETALGEAGADAGADAGMNVAVRDLVGRIASIRATIAVAQHDAPTISAQARRALETLSPASIPVRIAVGWQLGYAHFLSGDMAAARNAYQEALTRSQAIGHLIIHIMASIGLGQVAEAGNQMDRAELCYAEALRVAGAPAVPAACEAHLGLARVAYARDDLEAAEQHWQHSIALARQVEHTDRVVACEILLARLQLARGDPDGAALTLARVGREAHDRGYTDRIPEIAALRIVVLLRQGNLLAAAQRADRLHDPFSRARARLAAGDAQSALIVLGAFTEGQANYGRDDTALTARILRALALDADGAPGEAVSLFEEALEAAEPDSVIRPFIDEALVISGMQALLARVKVGPHGAFARRLSEALARAGQRIPGAAPETPPPGLIEPLSRRETEVLQLIAQGLSNDEICGQLYLALDTVKGHNRRIFEKLQVRRRTEAVARARALGLI